MAKAKGKSEKFAEDARELLKKKLGDLEIEELIEYGGLTVLGILIYDALGEVPVYELPHYELDSKLITKQKMIYNSRRGLRNGLVALAKVMNTDFNVLRTLFGAGPEMRIFSILGEPMLNLVDVKKQRMVFPLGKGISELVGWFAVPQPYRTLLALSAPSFLFILIEFVKEIVELG